MTRAEALACWRRVAAGELETIDPEDGRLHGWIVDVAREIVDADGADVPARAGRLLSAVGLAGPLDVDHELWTSLELLDSFLQPPEGAQGLARGERMRILINAARASGRIEHDVSDPELRKRIERRLGSARGL